MRTTLIRLATLSAAVISLAVAYRYAPGVKPSPVEPLVHVLQNTDDVALQRDVLRGMHEALHGRRKVVAPAAWSAVYPKLSASTDPEVREKTLALAVLFGDSRALADVRRAVADPHAEPGWRRFALRTLVDSRSPDAASVLTGALGDSVLRGAAIRGLAATNDVGVPPAILAVYRQLTDSEKSDAVATLASRPAYAMALLAAVERGEVPRRDLSAYTARQLLAMQDGKLTERLTAVWGAVRPPAKEKAARLARYKAVATSSAVRDGDRVHGRQLFAKMCATCHTLFDDGARIGPDLTGSQRANPEYVLSKVLDPSAVVARDYQVTMVLTKAGRTVTGLVKEEDEKTLALQTANELVRVAKSDVDERTKLPQSMMPEGLLNDHSDKEVCDLLAYLAGNGQVLLPKTTQDPRGDGPETASSPKSQLQPSK